MQKSEGSIAGGFFNVNYLLLEAASIGASQDSVNETNLEWLMNCYIVQNHISFFATKVFLFKYICLKYSVALGSHSKVRGRQSSTKITWKVTL